MLIKMDMNLRVQVHEHTHTHRYKTRKTKQIFNYTSTSSTVAIYVIYVCKQCAKHTKTIYHLNGGAINISCDDNTLHFTKSTGTVQSYISSEIQRPTEN